MKAEQNWITGTLSRRKMLSVGARATLAALAVSFPPIEAHGASTSGKRYRAAFRALDKFVAQYMSEMNAPGMTLSLADRDAVLYAATYGFSDLDHRARVRPEELFHIGSITKSFVAIALLQLREEGKLDLHKPVAQYLPWLRIESRFAPITAHHLLTHTAGLPEGFPLFLADGSAKHSVPYAPGEHFHYSNLGYIILGHLLATLDSRPYSECIRARILSPLGMIETAPVINSTILARTAKSYVPFRSDRPYARFGELTRATELIFDEAAGSIASTGRDMGLYASMLANRGRTANTRLISPESFELLVKPWIKREELGPETHYGYGLMIEQRDGHAIARHTGGMVSFASALQVDLDDGTAAFASINAMQGYRPNPVTVYALQALQAVRTANRPPPLPAANGPAKIERAADYSGSFTSPQGRTLGFEAKGERLFLLYGKEKLPVQTSSEEGFLVEHPDFDRFLFRFGRAGKEKGPIIELSHGPDWYLNDQYPGPPSFTTPVEWEAFTGHYRNETPWLTSLRIVRRKDKLWLDQSYGSDLPLAPIDHNRFRVADSAFNPEWIQFLDVVNGRARHLKFSGEDFWRVDSP